MHVSLTSPDVLADRLGEAGDLSRRALAAFAAEEYRTGRLNKRELRHLLGFAAGDELVGFLKARGIFENYTMADLKQERQVLQRFGY